MPRVYKSAKNAEQSADDATYVSAVSTSSSNHESSPELEAPQLEAPQLEDDGMPARVGMAELERATSINAHPPNPRKR
jgi:hypothetical protein